MPPQVEEGVGQEIPPLQDVIAVETQKLPESRGIQRACWAGIGLLLVQSVFGGLTVIYQLPDLVSTTHLALAFLFLGLAAGVALAGLLDAAASDREVWLVTESPWLGASVSAWMTARPSAMPAAPPAKTGAPGTAGSVGWFTSPRASTNTSRGASGGMKLK